MKLLLTQKNDIFDTIVEEGFNPSEFEFTEELITKNEIATYFRFKKSKYYFMFRIDRIYFETKYSPATNSLESEEDKLSTWKQTINKVKRWLKCLRKEINTTDKWEKFSKELNLIQFTFQSNSEDEKFTSDEIKLIDLKIESIKNEIQKLELPQNTIDILNSKLDNLNRKTSELTKTDWKELFLGAIIGTIMSSAIPSNTSAIIWAIIKQVFKQYILP